MSEPVFTKPRSFLFEGGVYVIRDTLHANGKPSGQCQYAQLSDGMIAWLPCTEGVMFKDIAPMVVVEN